MKDQETEARGQRDEIMSELVFVGQVVEVEAGPHDGSRRSGF